MADVVGSVLAVNFVQGPDYLQDVAVSEANAANSAARAKQSELNALGSANKAHQHENNAADSASAAKVSEEHAKTSEEHAKTSEERAGAYAATAFGASAPAWSSAETYNYPQVVAYKDGNTYRCVGTNVTGRDVPSSSNKWFRITLDMDDFWEIDMQGNYMPTVTPMYSSKWTLDINGDLEPIEAN